MFTFCNGSICHMEFSQRYKPESEVTYEIRFISEIGSRGIFIFYIVRFKYHRQCCGLWLVSRKEKILPAFCTIIYLFIYSTYLFFKCICQLTSDSLKE